MACIFEIGILNVEMQQPGTQSCSWRSRARVNVSNKPSSLQLWKVSRQETQGLTHICYLRLFKRGKVLQQKHCICAWRKYHCLQTLQGYQSKVSHANGIKIKCDSIKILVAQNINCHSMDKCGQLARSCCAWCVRNECLNNYQLRDFLFKFPRLWVPAWLAIHNRDSGCCRLIKVKEEFLPACLHDCRNSSRVSWDDLSLCSFSSLSAVNHAIA